MTEHLLQFIWQFQYFTKKELATAAGESIQVIFPGQLNTNQGPDFSNARISIGSTTWAGHVELHVKSSDWDRHGHTGDSNYDNVILHVVWEDDAGKTFSRFPVLELKSRVPKLLLQRYAELMKSTSFIPCEKSIGLMRGLSWQSWKERLLAERLTRKSDMVKLFLQQNNQHWEETFWWMLARNFGIRVNEACFESVARSIPVTLLAKHKAGLHQLEALLFGQAGLLQETFDEDYPVLLQKEYRFLQQKYGLEPVPVPVHFLRMRPGNFPTIRLAQLAMLVHESAHLFSRVRETTSIKELRRYFAVTANDYWHYHYRFDHPSKYSEKKLGQSMLDTIIINTLAPVLFAYGDIHNDQSSKDKALQWLEETAAETNAITKGFRRLEVDNKSAFDSQALLELKARYCDQRHCLQCSVGNFLLGSAGDVNRQ